MEKPDEGGPAFPQTQFQNARGEQDFPWNGWGMGGMSLRDWFAGQALAGMSDSVREAGEGLTVRETLAVALKGMPAMCYLLADAMLAERTKS